MSHPSDEQEVPREVLAERVRGLVAMAAADGRVGRREVKLIEALCQRWGAPKELLRAALAEAEEGQTRVVVPQSATERKVLLKGLVQVAAADGVIEPAERSMLEAFAERVGLDAIGLEQLVQRALQKRKAGQGRSKSEERSQSEERRRRSDSDEQRRPRSDADLARLREQSEERRRLASEGRRRAASTPPPLPAPSGPPPLPVGAPVVGALAAGALVAPPPQRPLPAHPEATPVGLDPKGPEVFGEPPWGDRPGPVVRCAVCAARVPARLRTCPYCERPVQGEVDPWRALRGIDVSSQGFKVGLVLVLVVAALVGPFVAGRWEGAQERALAERLVDALADPSEDEIDQARAAERARQEALQKELQELEAQAAQRKPQDEELRRLRALSERDPKSLLDDAMKRREVEFRRLFPEAR